MIKNLFSISENAIRPFTVGRKNWLFADSPKGADTDWRNYPEELDHLMPWSETVREQCGN